MRGELSGGRKDVSAAARAALIGRAATSVKVRPGGIEPDV
jgi:hypothetical protein